MKRLIYLSMAALLAFCALSCNKDDSEVKPGSIARPYTTEEAVKAVSNLTWTSNTEYETTDVVYVRGKITKVAMHHSILHLTKRRLMYYSVTEFSILRIKNIPAGLISRRAIRW